MVSDRIASGGEASGTPPVRPFDPLRHRNFRLLLAARSITHLGNAVAPVALAFAVLDHSGSATDLGLVIGARSVANVALVLVGGVLADRLPRTLILCGATALAALSQAAVAALVLTDAETIPLLIALSAVNGAAAAAAMPAAGAITPQTVPESLLQQANAVLGSSTGLANVAGSALGGALVAAVGPGWGIAVDAVTFAAASLCFLALREESGPRAPAGRPLADLREGWTEFVSRSWVWRVVLQFLVINAVLAGGLHVLGPVVADREFGRAAWGVVLAAEMTGVVVGGLLATRWQPRHALLVGSVLVVVEAVPLALLAVAPLVVPLAIAMFVAGLAVAQFDVSWEVALQENIPRQRLARIYSYDMLGSFVAMPLGQMSAGPLVAAVGLGPALLGAAGLTVLATLGVATSREVRRLQRRGGARPENQPP